MWSSIQILNFIGYILTELFRKPDNWRQIYKQTSSILTMFREDKLLVRHVTMLRNSYFFRKIQKQPPELQKQSPEVFPEKWCSQKFCKLHGKTPLLESFFNKVASRQPASFVKKDSNTRAFLLSLRNFYEHLFSRTSANNCFWRCSMKKVLL